MIAYFKSNIYITLTSDLYSSLCHQALNTNYCSYCWTGGCGLCKSCFCIILVACFAGQLMVFLSVRLAHCSLSHDSSNCSFCSISTVFTVSYIEVEHC